jgi:hypothetical protein
MKWIFAAAVLFFQVDASLAGTCRPITNSEIKDMRTDGVERAYCRYVKDIAANKKELNDLNQLVLSNTQKGMPEASFADTKKSIEKLNETINDCIDQQKKVIVSINNRNIPLPDCEDQ